MSYTYTTARIRTKETDILSKTDILRVLSTTDYGSAVRLISEKGYKITNGEPDFEAKEKEMWSIISDSVPEDVIYVLRINKDFYNLKTAIKSEHTRRDTKQLLADGGNFDKDVIYESVTNHLYEALPDELRNAAEEAHKILSAKENIQKADIKIDSAMLIYREAVAKKTGDRNVIEYIKRCSDVENLKTAQRCILQQADSETVEMAVVNVGSLDTEALTEAVLSGMEAFGEFLQYSGYPDGQDQLKKSPTEFEKWCDDIVMHYAKSRKYDDFSSSAVIAYMHAVKVQNRVLKLILSGKRNEMDTQLIEERVRDTYE